MRVVLKFKHQNKVHTLAANESFQWVRAITQIVIVAYIIT